MSGGRAVFLGIAMLLPTATADARCMYLVLSVKGEFRRELPTDTRLVLWPTPESLNTDTEVKRDGLRFRATVLFYPHGADADGQETCAGRPDWVLVLFKTPDGEQEVARLAFPDAFRNIESTTWEAKVSIRVPTE